MLLKQPPFVPDTFNSRTNHFFSQAIESISVMSILYKVNGTVVIFDIYS
jgi:hypothetical protein